MILCGNYITKWDGDVEINTRCGVNLQSLLLDFADVSNDDTDGLDHLDDEYVEVDILGRHIQCQAEQGELTAVGRHTLQSALVNLGINELLAPEPAPAPALEASRAIFVSEATITDPDSQLPVELSIYKDSSSGGMFGVDSSYLAQLDGDILPNIFSSTSATTSIILTEG